MYYDMYLVLANKPVRRGIQIIDPTSQRRCYECTPNNAVELTKQTMLPRPSYSQSSHLTIPQIITTMLFPRP
jgi:hypothetical protein